MLYNNKYLKYKNKYLKNKILKGGGIISIKSLLSGDEILKFSYEDNIEQIQKYEETIKNTVEYINALNILLDINKEKLEKSKSELEKLKSTQDYNKTIYKIRDDVEKKISSNLFKLYSEERFLDNSFDISEIKNNEIHVIILPSMLDIINANILLTTLPIDSLYFPNMNQEYKTKNIELSFKDNTLELNIILYQKDIIQDNAQFLSLLNYEFMNVADVKYSSVSVNRKITYTHFKLILNKKGTDIKTILEDVDISNAFKKIGVSK